MQGAGARAQGRIEGSTVKVDGGAVAGKWAANAQVRAYLGIPFAAPPLGDLRWKPPQPVAPWQGVRAATEFGPQCLQPGATPKSVYFEYSGGDLPMSEDCLTLNIVAHGRRQGPAAGDGVDLRRRVSKWARLESDLQRHAAGQERRDRGGR